MTALALAFSFLIIALGVVGLVSPSRVVAMARSFATPTGLYVAAALRIGMGLALFLAAPDSRAPGVLRLVGIAVFVAGVVTVVLRIDRVRRLVDWWSAQGSGLVRAQAAFAMALGLLLAYALIP